MEAKELELGNRVYIAHITSNDKLSMFINIMHNRIISLPDEDGVFGIDNPFVSQLNASECHFSYFYDDILELVWYLLRKYQDIIEANSALLTDEGLYFFFNTKINKHGEVSKIGFYSGKIDYSTDTVSSVCVQTNLIWDLVLVPKEDIYTNPMDCLNDLMAELKNKIEND